ncbi:hypothetical protein M1C59_13920 [Gordonia terrae]|uniref:hypothetical protein n=1 Tax=Gordonia terrae TaxID=2055 RepID=UPI00200B221E|nr:hypothetical protein [Gordonia terrae]UPW07194.1 hypothetical protein M1C59_13920 [Gordonia terrae]
MAFWTLLTSIIAAIFAVVGVIIMWRQFVVARESARGRGLMPTLMWNGDSPARLGVGAAGPGVWADFTGMVATGNGDVVMRLWHRPRFDVESGHIDIDVSSLMPPFDDQYFVICWHQPSGTGVRLMGIRHRLVRDASTEEFRWYRVPQWYVRQGWWFPFAGKERRAGRWKRVDRDGIDSDRLPGLPNVATAPWMDEWPDN